MIVALHPLPILGLLFLLYRTELTTQMLSDKTSPHPSHGMGRSSVISNQGVYLICTGEETWVMGNLGPGDNMMNEK